MASERVERLIALSREPSTDYDVEKQLRNDVQANNTFYLRYLNRTGDPELFSVLVKTLIVDPYSCNIDNGYDNTLVITELASVAINKGKVDEIVSSLFDCGRYLDTRDYDYDIFAGLSPIWTSRVIKASWLIQLYMDHCNLSADDSTELMITQEQIEHERLGEEEYYGTWGEDNEDQLRSLNAFILLRDWLKARNGVQYVEDIPESMMCIPPYDSADVGVHIYWIVVHSNYATS